MGYAIYDVHINRNTYNWGGCEWVVDGENGRDTYPGSWDEKKVRKYYRNGWSCDHADN